MAVLRRERDQGGGGAVLVHVQRLTERLRRLLGSTGVA